MRVLSGLAWLVLTVTLCLARSAFGDRVLVVLDVLTEESSYSHFFDSLRRKLSLIQASTGYRADNISITERGFQLTLRETSKGPELFQEGEPAFDHVLFFSRTCKREPIVPVARVTQTDVDVAYRAV